MEEKNSPTEQDMQRPLSAAAEQSTSYVRQFPKPSNSISYFLTSIPLSPIPVIKLKFI